MTNRKKRGYIIKKREAIKFITHEYVDPVHYVIIKLLCTIIDILISDN